MVLGQDHSTALRRYDIDWLRIYVILLLFPYHAARIFDVWEPNYVKSPDLSFGLSWLIVLIGFWFMPLMFWLAGSASWYALERRSGGQYLRERSRRLFIPLLVGILVIVPPEGYLAKLSQTDYHETYWQFLQGYFQDFSDLSGYFGSFTPAHLWFILYLLVFSLVGTPLFVAAKSKAGRQFLDKLWSHLSNPWSYLSVFLLLTATEALPSPGGKNPFFFFFLFLFGYISCANDRFAALSRGMRRTGMLFLMPLVALYVLAVSQFAYAPDWSVASVLLALTRNLALWLALVVILGYAQDYLQFGARWLAYLNQAIFPIYVIHQTVLLITGYLLIETPLSVTTKFLLTAALSLFCSLAIYELIIRRFAVTRWAFGVKHKPSPSPTRFTTPA